MSADELRDLLDQAAAIAQGVAATTPDEGSSVFAWLTFLEPIPLDSTEDQGDWFISDSIWVGDGQDVHFRGLGQGSTQLDQAYGAAEEFLQSNGVDVAYFSRMD